MANVVGDWLLCPKYGLAGVAGASVLASALGYGYLVTALIQAGRWPRPFAWPRKARHMLPFLRFAGPVLFAVFLKTMTLANMTTAACGLGTAAAAGHQLFQTLFLLSAVALGNPLSWAAQAFLPPLLAAYCAGREPGEVSQTAVVTLRKLVAFALCGSVPTSFLVVLFCRKLGWLLSNDPSVLQVMAESSYSLVPFLMLYPVLLTLEGALYGAQERVTVLCLSALFWWLSGAAMHILSFCGMLTLSRIWLSVGLACAVSMVATGFFALREIRRPKCYLFVDDATAPPAAARK